MRLSAAFLFRFSAIDAVFISRSSFNATPIRAGFDDVSVQMAFSRQPPASHLSASHDSIHQSPPANRRCRQIFACRFSLPSPPAFATPTPSGAMPVVAAYAVDQFSRLSATLSLARREKWRRNVFRSPLTPLSAFAAHYVAMPPADLSFDTINTPRAPPDAPPLRRFSDISGADGCRLRFSRRYFDFFRFDARAMFHREYNATIFTF